MKTISVEQIQALRVKTGYGVMDVKRALEESDGDNDRAEQLLRKKGGAKAAAKAGRAMQSGRVEAYLHGDGKIGVLLEVNAETDFVAKNDEFQRFVHDLALQVASMRPDDVDELLSQPFIKEPAKTVQDLLHEMVGKIGENLSIRRFVRYELGED